MSQVLATTTVSKDYMDAIMQHMLDPLFIIRANGTIRSSNEAAQRLLGYQEDELLKKPVEELFFEKQGPLRGEGLEKILRGTPVQDLELEMLKKNGETIPVLLSASLFKDKEGQLAGVICGVRDMTERKKFETRMLQTEKLSAVGQLAAGVAHEVNNPLGVILGFAQALTSRVEAGHAFEMPLKSIEREAIRCRNLVQDLLTFSRASVNEHILTDINLAIAGALTLVETRAKIKQITIRQELAPDVPKILGSQGKIQQVIINLSNNAIDAMQSGGILTIQTRLLNDMPHAWVCLAVIDDGMGITPDVQSKMFNPFFTTKAVGEGTGLGLSLVHEIVKSHSGTIEVNSRPGRTEFLIKFPVKNTAELGGRVSIMPVPRGA
jgi:PAS domain S-box-containing protein